MPLENEIFTYGNGFTTEIDFNDTRIHKLANNENTANDLKLPNSFIAFSNKISNGLVIDIGNQLRIFQVSNEVTGLPTVQSRTNEFINNKYIDSEDFIIFGENGVDSETWAFYTKKSFKNGEYPIVWITLGASNNDHYVLFNSRFDRFLTIQYYYLKSSDYASTTKMTYEELVKNTPNNKNFESESQYDLLLSKLYSKYDPIIPAPLGDLYSNTLTINQLDSLIDSINDSL